MSRINRELQLTLQAALREAVARRHAYLTVEHLLLALSHDERGAEVLRHCGVDVRRLKARARPLPREDLAAESGEEPVETGQTLAFHRVMQAALRHAESAERPEVEAGDLIAAMFLEPESHAMSLLRAQGISRLDVLQYVSHGISKLARRPVRRRARAVPTRGPAVHLRGRGGDRRSAARRSRPNLVGAGARGQARSAGGPARRARPQRSTCWPAGARTTRSSWASRASERPRSPRAWRSRIAAGQVPDDLRGSEIYAVDLGAMLAGTKYRGDFEARFKAFVYAVQQRPSPIVFIDEIHTVLGAGAAQGATVDASNMLKPLLQSGELRCIGSTTYQEYRHFEKDRALARRFQKIDVAEPSLEDAVKIVEGLAPRYSEHHGVHYTQPALRACVELAARHLHGPLPARQGDRRDGRGRRGRAPAPGREAQERGRARRRAARREDGEGADRGGLDLGPRGTRDGSSRTCGARLRTGRGDLHRRARGQARARGPRRRGPPGRLVPVRRTDGRGQDRAGQTARAHAGRGVPALRHERVHGEARGRAPDRRAARLRRLRRGRDPGRVDPAPAARRGAARRDREGASRPVRHPPAGDGSRHADRQPRPRGRASGT